MIDGRPRYYILNGVDVVPVLDVLIWGRWLEANQDARRIGLDTGADGVEVSTVFIGLDHSYTQTGPPVVFETMIFGGEHDSEQWRYSTYSDAVDGHRAACLLVGIADVLAAEFVEV